MLVSADSDVTVRSGGLEDAGPCGQAAPHPVPWAAGARTRREVVEIALRRVVEKGRVYAELLKARGRHAWKGDIDGRRRPRS